MTLGSAPPRISQSSPWLQPAFWQRYGHWLLYLLALSYICLSAMMRFDGVEARLMLGDNDDLMRLVSLRDWLGGQGWYDSQQYRLLPPEGVQMHWSRYVDAGLAALYLPLAQIMPTERAILWLVTLWPSLLWALAVLIAGQGSRALLGNWGALSAVLAVLTWGKISSEFQPGRIDHHNLQILLGLAIFYLAVLPERPKFYGICAGVLTAASLAIGLEMLPYLAMIWFMAVLRHALNLPGSRLHLIGFACGIGLAAPLLMAGQLPIALWSRLYCDILALPVLGLIALGIIATLAPVALEARITKPWLRIFLVLGVALLGLAAFWPLLGACARGPYAMIAPETQEIIDTRITEGMAIGRFFQQSPVQSLTIMLPVALTLLGFGALLASRPGPRPLRGWHRRFAHLGFRPATEAAAIGAIFLTLASFLLAMTQIRAANLMAPRSC